MHINEIIILQDQGPLVDHGDAVAEVGDLVHHVGAHEDGQVVVVVPDVLEDVPHLRHTPGVETGGGLVEDDDGGAVQEGEAEGDPLLHTLGERPDLLVGPIAHLDLVEDLGGLVGDALLRHAEDLPDVPEGLDGCEVGVELRGLDDRPHALEGGLGLLRHVVSVDVGVAGGGADEVGQ